MQIEDIGKIIISVNVIWIDLNASPKVHYALLIVFELEAKKSKAIL